MKKLLTLLFVFAAIFSIAQKEGGKTTKPSLAKAVAVNHNENGSRSLTGSYVVFEPSAGGDAYYIPGTTQDFVFRAESFTPDYEYVYSLWLEFPPDWTVNSVSVIGTPACNSGSTWGDFGFVVNPSSSNTVRINHARYQANVDQCSAYYMVNVTTGAESGNAPVSWYWDGDGYAGAPHHPCSSNNYTPSEMAAEPCDEMVNPPAVVPMNMYTCPENSVFSQPPVGYSTSYINSFGFIQVIYENFYGITQPITGVRFWLSSIITYPVQFKLEFYADNGGALGPLVESWDMNLTPVFTTINGMDVFDVTFPSAVFLSTGWLGINANDARLGFGNTGIGWWDSTVGDNTIIFSDDLVNYYTTSPYNMSFCLTSSGIPPVPVSNWALFIGIGLILAVAVVRFRKLF